jgi:hypothetical protein
MSLKNRYINVCTDPPGASMWALSASGQNSISTSYLLLSRSNHTPTLGAT